MADLKSTSSEIRRTRANAVRALSMDAVQQAKSGHPGMPMGMADIAEVLWTDSVSYTHLTLPTIYSV